jgi:integrase
MFRHGLLVSQACELELDQVDIESRVLHVRRLKAGLSTMQPVTPRRTPAISAWPKEPGLSFKLQPPNMNYRGCVLGRGAGRAFLTR